MLGKTCVRESPRLFFEQANGYTARRHEAARPRMNRRAVFAFVARDDSIERRRP